MQLAPRDDPYSRKELGSLVDAIRKRYGYDFRHYSVSSLGRRIDWTMRQARIDSLVQLERRLVEDPTLFKRLVENLSISVTAMFRDPAAFRVLRERVLPILATYPHVRVWCAGVATGEEAYSMAILLSEEGLYDRSLIYATDFNPLVVRQAFKGRFSLDRMADYTRNYIAAGGRTAFSKYYTTTSKLAYILPGLRENIVFSTHNLVTDGIFNEFHLILCRNVLIYFDDRLMEQVVDQFRESLAMRCFLFLGDKERLRRRAEGRFFEVFSEPAALYRTL